jgi:signal peptide peptidase SppA
MTQEGQHSNWLSGVRLRRPPVVGVVRLSGVIGPLGPWRGGLSLATLAAPLQRAFSLRRASAVALSVNSPGGSAVQASLIAKRIRDLAAEKKLPVLAFVEDVAASGGYWLASAADEIFADESSIVGSSGVSSAGFGFPQVLERLGVERRVYTAGPRKAMLDPVRREDSDDVARLKALQEDIHASFKLQVRARRGDRLKGDDESLFSGDIWTGKRALELGLIDGIGDIRAVLRARFGDKVRMRLLGGERGWLFRRLRAGHASGEWARDMLAAVEERLLWSRYGL